MNMKLLKRVSVMTASALSVLGILFVLLETFGVHVFCLFNKAASASVVLLLLLIVILIALAGVCAYSFYLAFNGEKAYKARMITLKGTQDDVVLIKQETLDEFVKSVIGQPDGVTEIAVSTQYHDMALDVTVTMKVDMSTDISAATSAMQSVVREQLENVNGIKLSGVTVVISGINVPENTEGMKMPWADKKEEEKAEETAEEIARVTEDAVAEAEEDTDGETAEEAVEETAEEEIKTDEPEENYEEQE